MLNQKLKNLAEKIQDAQLRGRVLDFLENPTFTLNDKTYSGVPLDISPGGLSHHHTYRGGYLEHIEATAALALSLCDVVEQVYSGRVDGDLVLAGGFVARCLQTSHL